MHNSGVDNKLIHKNINDMWTEGNEKESDRKISGDKLQNVRRRYRVLLLTYLLHGAKPFLRS